MVVSRKLKKLEALCPSLRSLRFATSCMVTMFHRETSSVEEKGEKRWGRHNALGNGVAVSATLQEESDDGRRFFSASKVLKTRTTRGSPRSITTFDGLPRLQDALVLQLSDP